MLSVKFLNRVRMERTVDTKKYRYNFDSLTGIVYRKDIAELDTTSDCEAVAKWFEDFDWVQ